MRRRGPVLACVLASLTVGCAPAPPFQSNFTPRRVAEPKAIDGPPAFDQKAFDAMVEAGDRRAAPCKLIWSLTGSPHVVGVRCPDPPGVSPPSPR
jgi:hypothetical protein